MVISETPLQGLKLIQLKAFADDRGFFVERFNLQKFSEQDLPTEFVQDNMSWSVPNVVRGLHYQVNPHQGKLVGVAYGRILDVAVDLRHDSPTFGQHYSAELSLENNQLLWIPQGFGHGFCVLGDSPACVTYKVDQLYSGPGDRAINPLDPDLKIEWPVESPILSDKDRTASSFADYKANPEMHL